MMPACQDGRCMASKVNSANNCYNTVLRSKAVANSSIVVGYLQSGIYRVSQRGLLHHHAEFELIMHAYDYVVMKLMVVHAYD